MYSCALSLPLPCLSLSLSLGILEGVLGRDPRLNLPHSYG